MGGAKPKAIMPLDDHEPLLHFLLKGLKRAGVDDLMVVTGFMPGAVTEFVNEHWGAEGVTYVRNTRYASWGNFHSARMAIDQSPGFDLMIVNSDIVVHPEVFTRTSEAPGDLVLTVEERFGLDAEDMRVRLDGRRVTDIGKDLEKQFSNGEFCGVSLMREPAQVLYKELATAVEWERSSEIYYEDVYRRMLGRVDARAAEVRPGEYAEVDLPEDVKNAIEVVERHRNAYDADQQPV
jgi:choline kinase